MMFSFQLYVFLPILVFLISCNEGEATMNKFVKKNEKMKEYLRKIDTSKKLRVEVKSSDLNLRGLAEETYGEILYGNLIYYAYGDWDKVPNFATKKSEIQQSGCQDANPIEFSSIIMCFEATEEDDGFIGFISFRYGQVESENVFSVVKVKHIGATSCSGEDGESRYDLTLLSTDFIIDCTIDDDYGDLSTFVVAREKLDFNQIRDSIVKPAAFLPVTGYENDDCTELIGFIWFNLDDTICTPEEEEESLSVYSYQRNTLLSFYYSLTNGQCEGDTIDSDVEFRRGICTPDDDDYYTIIDNPSIIHPDTVEIWGQCGGKNYNGGTSCAAGSSCVYKNTWYSQCKPK